MTDALCGSGVFIACETKLESGSAWLLQGNGSNF